MNTVFVR